MTAILERHESTSVWGLNSIIIILCRKMLVEPRVIKPGLPLVRGENESISLSTLPPLSMGH